MTDLAHFIKGLPASGSRKRTYLEILQVSTRETIMANLLAYYFRPDEDHGLGDLFIRGLLNTACYELLSPNSCRPPEDVIKLKEEKILWAKVKTEDVTNDDKRIDLVIETDKLLIAIEFKINHSLNNPLRTYYDHVQSKYPSAKPKYFVVLTPVWKKPEKECQLHPAFHQVLISHFIENIQSFIKEDPELSARTDLKYQQFQDLITTFTNRKITFEMIKEYRTRASEETEFKDKLDKVYSDLQDIKSELERKMMEVNKGLDGFSLLSSSKNKLQSVIERKMTPVDSIKLRLTLKNWELEEWQNGVRRALETPKTFLFDAKPEDIIKGVSEKVGAVVI